jgi:hypothetical protein
MAPSGYYRRPVGQTDVYMDDFLGLVQGGKRRRRWLRNLIFHAIDSVFRPPEPGDHPLRKDPISVKKLLKGDGDWETSKVILGWLIDTMGGATSPIVSGIPSYQAASGSQVLA